jgi:hypothetical protein
MVISAISFCPPRASAAPIAEQTVVTVKLLQSLQSGHERRGDRIRMEVAEDLKGPDRAVLIPKGTPVVGTITRSSGRKMFGRPGKLDFTIDYIKLGDQVRVPLRSTSTEVRGRNNSAAAITTAVLLTPVAVLLKGREVTVEEGRQFTVFVDQTTDIPSAAPSSAARPAAKPDPARISVIRLKNGDAVTGTVVGFKDGAYLVTTDLGQLTITQGKVESITEQ